MEPRHERCCICDEHTGHAGRGEDSLYCDGCDTGPYCHPCYDEHMDGHKDQTISALRAEVEELRGAFNATVVRELNRDCESYRNHIVQTKADLAACREKLALYEKAVEPVREAFEDAKMWPESVEWKQHFTYQAIRDCIRTLSETK